MKDIVYFVLPAYNEEANIEDVIKQWHPVCEKINAEGNEAKLVIANDGSKDNTFRIMQGLQKKYPYLTPLDKPNSGHGATVLYLYHYAIDHGATTVRPCRKSFGRCGKTVRTSISRLAHAAADKTVQVVYL